MSYQVLARKWRPQDFSAVVGQQPIVTALRNALGDGRIAQAYLFSGIRGVGKTSVARILAKALNCERGPAADPCNECTICREITSGDDLDVLEFDAATYSKVDQVRELTESLPYAPARDRYKVIILDEIHRLSRQAFDALLKIVEEPPPHLIFIFATTEAEAVPVTVLSRCQEFRFRRVPQEELVKHLEMLAREEKIEAGPSALRLVARAGDGSVRDAVALLDQLATFGSGKIADEDAARLLGGMGNEMLLGLLEAVLGGDSAAVSSVVADVDERGWDPRYVYGEFLSFCRTALHLGLGGDPARVDMPLEEARELAEKAKSAGYENLLRLLHLLLESEATVRRSESGSLAVEVAWLRGTELPKLVAIEELLAGREPAGGTAARPEARKGKTKSSAGKRQSKSSTARSAAPPEPAKQQPAAEPPRETAAPPEPQEAQSSGPRPAPTAAPPDTEEAETTRPTTASSSGDNGDFAPIDGEPTADAFIELISRRKQSLAAHLSEAQGLELVDGRLTILAPPGDTWLENTLQRKSNAKLLDDAIHAVWGPGITWRLATGSAVPEPEREESTEEKSPGLDRALEDPRVQTVLDIFGGSVESVEERGAD